MTLPRLLRLNVVEVDLERGELRALPGVPPPAGLAPLNPKELALLRYLAERPGVVVGRDALLAEVWGYASHVVSRTVDTTLARLRAKVEGDPAVPVHVLTVKGEGYRFQPAGAPPALELDPIVGRVVELTLLLSLFDEGRRLVTVRGPGGIGKTRLCQEVLLRQRRVGRSVTFVDLAPLRSVADVSDALGRALRGRSPEDPEDLLELLAGLGPHLILLDNAETVAAGLAASVSAWLARAPGLRLLVTSREALELRGERVVVLDALSLPDARALFWRRAADMGFDPGEDAELDPLLERLDRLPLAIELAAAQLDLYALPELDRRLAADRFGVLSGGGRDARPHSLAGAIAASWDTLSTSERRALGVVALLPAPCLLDVVDAGCEALEIGAAGAHLSALRRRSLLQVEPGPSRRFRLLDNLRAWAHRHADPRDAARVVPALLSWYARFGAEQLARVGWPGEGRAAIGWLSAEVDNLEALLALGTEGEESLDAGLVAVGVYRRLGPVGRAASLVDGLLVRVRRPQARGRVLAEAAAVWRVLGELDRAIAAATEAAVLLDADPDAAGRVRILEAQLRFDHGQPEEGRALFEELLSRWTEPSALRLELLTVAVTCNPWSGERRRQHLEEGLRLSEIHPLPTPRGVLRAVEASTAWRAGHHEAAREAFDEVIRLARDNGDPRALGVALVRAGAHEVEGGDPARCAALLDEAERLWRRLGAPLYVAAVDSNRASLELQAGRPRAAMAHYERCITLFERLGDGRQHLVTSINLAQACLDAAEHTRFDLVVAGIGERLAYGSSRHRGLYGAVRGQMAIERGELDAAVEWFVRGREESLEAGDRRFAAWLASGEAVARALSGSPWRSVEAEARDLAEEAGDPQVRAYVRLRGAALWRAAGEGARARLLAADAVFPVPVSAADALLRDTVLRALDGAPAPAALEDVQSFELRLARRLSGLAVGSLSAG